MSPDFFPTPADFDADPPALAIRRHTDRCFFAVDELMPGPDGALIGFIVEGHRIDPDDVAEVRRCDEPGGGSCGSFGVERPG